MFVLLSSVCKWQLHKLEAFPPNTHIINNIRRCIKHNTNYSLMMLSVPSLLVWHRQLPPPPTPTPQTHTNILYLCCNVCLPVFFFKSKLQTFGYSPMPLKKTLNRGVYSVTSNTRQTLAITTAFLNNSPHQTETEPGAAWELGDTYCSSGLPL